MHSIGKIWAMPTIPKSTRTSLDQQLRQHARQNWPQLGDLPIRYHGQFAYVAGVLTHDDKVWPLMRLRYIGSAHEWIFALYRATKDAYDEYYAAHLQPCTPQQALDCACEVYEIAAEEV